MHTSDTALVKIMPIYFSVTLGMLNIFKAFGKPISLPLTALTALNVDSTPHTLLSFTLLDGS
jgi:hypothetical protein